MFVRYFASLVTTAIKNSLRLAIFRTQRTLSRKIYFLFREIIQREVVDREGENRTRRAAAINIVIIDFLLFFLLFKYRCYYVRRYMMSSIFHSSLFPNRINVIITLLRRFVNIRRGIKKSERYANMYRVGDDL